MTYSRTNEKPLVTPDLLKLCDERRDVKLSYYDSDEAEDRQANHHGCDPAGFGLILADLLFAFQGFLGQTSVIEWGKHEYARGENGGVDRWSHGKIGVGVDANIHILHRYRSEGPGSWRRVLVTTGSACAMAGATTIAGFAGLSN